MQKYIPRHIETPLIEALSAFPVVALVGPCSRLKKSVIRHRPMEPVSAKKAPRIRKNDTIHSIKNIIGSKHYSRISPRMRYLLVATVLMNPMTAIIRAASK